jgi:iron complex outermembrane receptor protein
MSRSKSVSGAVALAATLAASIADAQQAGQSGTVVLPTITVDTALESKGSLTVPAVAKQRKQLEETVGAVDFVDAASEQIQTRHVETLADALKNVPGVYAQDRFAQEIRLSIRGSSLTRSFHLRGIELLQDGIPVNLADGSGDFEQIDALYFRSIEVYKGGNALMFGTSTLGGAINFVSPTAYTALAPDIVRFDGGSFGTFRGNAQVSRVVGDFDFLVNGTFSETGGFRDHSEAAYNAINGNIGYRFAPGAETRFYFGNYYATHKLPGQLSFFDASSNPTKASLGATRGNIPIGGVFFGGNQARDIFDQRIANRTTFETDWGRLDLNSWFIYNTLYHPIFQVLDQYGYTAGFAPRFTGTGNLGGFRNDIILGGRIWAGHQADRRWRNLNGISASPQTFNARNDALNLEIYGEDRFFVTQDVALMAGLKLFSNSRKQKRLPFAGTTSSGTLYNDRTYSGILPKAGVIWYPTPEIEVFGDVTGSADVPDFTDLTQTTGTTTRFVPLEPQRAWTGEIGTRGQSGRFFWDATAYRADITNELLQFTVGGSTGIPANTFNAPHTIHQGIEFAAGVDLLRDLWGSGDAISVTQIWTLNDFFFVANREFGNNNLAGAPPNVLRTILAYNHPSGLYIAPSLDWAPVGAFADYANTIRTPGYALLGVQAGFTVPSGMLPNAPSPYGVSFYLDARNLTDQRYISDVATVVNASRPANQEIYFPGTGRAVYGGMKVTF